MQSVPNHAFKRIPTLDGWRGIAILLVLIAHFQAGYFYRHPFHDWAWLIIGTHGVGIFFVLSGYLITSRLLEEDRINFRSFCLRRFFRLMPTAWAYLGCLVILGFVLKTKLTGLDEIVPCVFFYRNYVFTSGPERAFTSHFWSLAVEEQFYLVWPAMLVIAKRRAVWIAVCGFVCFGLASATWFYSGLFVGCALAFASRHRRFQALILRNHNWVLPVSLLSFGWHVARFHSAIPLSESLTIALMLSCTSLNASSPASRVLEWQPLKELGVYSYSFYVWQELFLIPHTGGIGAIFLPFVAIGSYHWLEKPCVDLGRKVIAQGGFSRQMFSGLRSTV